MTDDHAQAAVFLKEIHRRAMHYAERIDPKGRRQYGTDPILAALDGIMVKAGHGLYAVGSSPTLHTDAETIAAVRKFKP